ncbi:hypothetical protein BKA70DRAFT_1560093 [Coprinopsis sp. MPI-PUGE-AT-0042]|nr:hypothetical protein BKA70DRAFT_1560093 [Coprinopsis sp. MPI-PUGE-AT-0042]
MPPTHVLPISPHQAHVLSCANSSPTPNQFLHTLDLSLNALTLMLLYSRTKTRVALSPHCILSLRQNHLQVVHPRLALLPSSLLHHPSVDHANAPSLAPSLAPSTASWEGDAYDGYHYSGYFMSSRYGRSLGRNGGKCFGSMSALSAAGAGEVGIPRIPPVRERKDSYDKGTRGRLTANVREEKGQRAQGERFPFSEDNQEGQELNVSHILILPAAPISAASTSLSSLVLPSSSAEVVLPSPVNPPVYVL